VIELLVTDDDEDAIAAAVNDMVMMLRLRMRTITAVIWRISTVGGKCLEMHSNDMASALRP
jgi:hypothetical protein